MTSGRAGRSSAIVTAVTELAHKLGLTVVVEGVETAEQMRLSTEVGADYAQGFFYARPMDAEGINRLLSESSVERGHVPLPRIPTQTRARV
jgi:EAL domain-containing protein (putative c-di-GMP-specific phosphodiesterase class I)